MLTASRLPSPERLTMTYYEDPGPGYGVLPPRASLRRSPAQPQRDLAIPPGRVGGRGARGVRAGGLRRCGLVLDPRSVQLADARVRQAGVHEPAVSVPRRSAVRPG